MKVLARIQKFLRPVYPLNYQDNPAIHPVAGSVHDRVELWEHRIDQRQVLQDYGIFRQYVLFDLCSLLYKKVFVYVLEAILSLPVLDLLD
ncbi:uncharacterized protein METZ01_LOCUS92841 [marine metagenome]|uniref:Uncharacterized protein n=1 Tax=marine metagenome TaxID=408172 RepID=A0A381VJZ1_9ZZZZ